VKRAGVLLFALLLGELFEEGVTDAVELLALAYRLPVVVAELLGVFPVAALRR